MAGLGDVRRRTMRRRRLLARLLYGVVIAAFCGAVYTLLTTLSPRLSSTPLLSRMAGTSTAGYQESPVAEDRLYIPAINSTLPIVLADGDEDLALTKGAVHRRPVSGSPTRGGNFVLAAHRFVLRWNPIETIRRSPLYNLHKTKVGDVIVVDYQGERYEYVIVRKQRVAPNEVSIEQPTMQSQLTLYSCELSGSASGRDVVIAVPKASRHVGDDPYVPQYL